jgi:hypothetical protein
MLYVINQRIWHNYLLILVNVKPNIKLKNQYVNYMDLVWSGLKRRVQFRNILMLFMALLLQCQVISI